MSPNQPQTNQTFYPTPFKINNTTNVNNCENL